MFYDWSDTILTIKKAVNSLKKLYRWVIRDDDIFTEICEAFTVITVINSYMMVAGMDQPKIGRFAYIHLLIRLMIISVIIALWEDESIFQSIKKHALRIKDINGIPEIKKIYKTILENKYGSICVIYTLIIVGICLVMITGIFVPEGGAELYFNLLILFACITVTIFLAYILEIIKALQNR